MKKKAACGLPFYWHGVPPSLCEAIDSVSFCVETRVLPMSSEKEPPMDYQFARTVRYLGRYYHRLPREGRMLVIFMVLMLLFMQAEYMGEKLGRALYYLTH
jgi:hypothetical protein